MKIKNYKDVDLELINENYKDLSPTIKGKEEKDEYFDIDSIDTYQEEIIEDDTYKDDLVMQLDIKQKEIELDTGKEIIEVVVFEELDTMLSKDYNSLKELNLEVEVLNNIDKNNALTKEAKNLEDEFIHLFNRLKELFKKYDNIYKDLDYCELKKIDTEYIKYLINDYSSFLDKYTLKKIISPDILEEYIDIINTLINLDKKKNNLEEKIEEKKEKHNIDKIAFSKMKNEYVKLETINDNVSLKNKDIEKELKKINDLIKNSESIKETVEYKKKLSFSLNKVIKGNILLSVSNMFPPTKKGNILRIGFMIMGINNLKNVIKEQEVKEIKNLYDVIDYSKKIENNTYNINDLVENIDDACKNIDEIRKKIKYEFKHYIDKIDDVKDLLININKLEKELNIKKEIALNYNNEFQKTLNENNEKVKKLDRYND